MVVNLTSSTFASGSFTISGTAGFDDGAYMIFGDPGVEVEFDSNGSTTGGRTVVDMAGSNTQMWNGPSGSHRDSSLPFLPVLSFVDNGNRTATFQLTASVGGPEQNTKIRAHNLGSSYLVIHSNGAGGSVSFSNIAEDIVIPRVTSSVTDLVFTTRFSAPGGIEVQSYGYLDAYAHEYSVHNNLNYRNLTVRGSN